MLVLGSTRLGILLLFLLHITVPAHLIPTLAARALDSEAQLLHGRSDMIDVQTQGRIPAYGLHDTCTGDKLTRLARSRQTEGLP